MRGPHSSKTVAIGQCTDHPEAQCPTEHVGAGTGNNERDKHANRVGVAQRHQIPEEGRDAEARRTAS